MQLTTLRSRIRGKVTSLRDSSYERVRQSMVWNRLTPGRYPSVIVQATSESDVVEAVRFARANSIKVAVRGGGHSWVGFSLRDESLLIDLGLLKHASIDCGARVAVIQPGINGGELNAMLEAQGLAFPVGHCPSVPMSGFLLGGGLGWNYNEWLPACFSIEAARVVTADGHLLIADAEHNPDLLWAVRGGGPGFFGAVIEYSIGLFPVPRAITTSTYYYPADAIEDVGGWAGEIARKQPRTVELAVSIGPAPSEISLSSQSSRFICSLSASAFLDQPAAAAAALTLLDSCPAASSCLSAERHRPTPISVLYQMGGLSFAEPRRHLGDTLWTDSPISEVISALRRHFISASPGCAATIAFSTGQQGPGFPGGCYSMEGDALLLCYAVWDRREDDCVNAAWHRGVMADLDRFAVGHYIGESDIVADPQRAQRCYTRANWDRLNILRAKYDPEGLFQGHFRKEG